MASTVEAQAGIGSSKRACLLIGKIGRPPDLGFESLARPSKRRGTLSRKTEVHLQEVRMRHCQHTLWGACDRCRYSPKGGLDLGPRGTISRSTLRLIRRAGLFKATDNDLQCLIKAGFRVRSASRKLYVVAQ